MSNMETHEIKKAAVEFMVSPAVMEDEKMLSAVINHHAGQVTALLSHPTSDITIEQAHPVWLVGEGDDAQLLPMHMAGDVARREQPSMYVITVSQRGVPA